MQCRVNFEIFVHGTFLGDLGGCQLGVGRLNGKERYSWGTTLYFRSLISHIRDSAYISSQIRMDTADSDLLLLILPKRAVSKCQPRAESK
jgi:hypothetical protein